jgi:hypothetical protein
MTLATFKPIATYYSYYLQGQIQVGQNTSSQLNENDHCMNLISFNNKAGIRDSKFLAAMVIRNTTNAFMRTFF